MNSKRLSELRYKGHITDSEYKELNLAIKALDVKTAYWIRQETPYGYANSYECSECGRVIWNDEGEEGLEDFPYCHCGCRMIDKKEKEE